MKALAVHKTQFANPEKPATTPLPSWRLHVHPLPTHGWATALKHAQTFSSVARSGSMTP